MAWADRVVKFGLRLQIVAAPKLTAEKLAKAILTAITDLGMRTRATALGERIRAESVVACVEQVIERHTASLCQRLQG